MGKKRPRPESKTKSKRRKLDIGVTGFLNFMTKNASKIVEDPEVTKETEDGKNVYNFKKFTENAEEMWDDLSDGEKKPFKKVKRKKKKPKDPDAPKRPSTAFFIYMGEKRPGYKDMEEFQKKKKDGTMGSDVAKVVKQIGKEWGELSEDEQVPYHAMAAKDKVRYEEGMKVYRKKKEKEKIMDYKAERMRKKKKKVAKKKKKKKVAKKKKKKKKRIPTSVSSSNDEMSVEEESSDSDSD